MTKDKSSAGGEHNEANENSDQQEPLPEQESLFGMHSPISLGDGLLSPSESPSPTLLHGALDDLSSTRSHSFDLQVGDIDGLQGTEHTATGNEEGNPNVELGSNTQAEPVAQRYPEISSQSVARMPQTRPSGSDGSSDDDNDEPPYKRTRSKTRQQVAKRYKSDTSATKPTEEDLEKLRKTIAENNTAFPLSAETKKSVQFIAPKDQTSHPPKTKVYEKPPQQKKESGRGSYKCGRCGAPKKNHICPYKVIIRPTEHKATQTEDDLPPTDDDVTMAVSRDWDPQAENHPDPGEIQPPDAEAREPVTTQTDNASEQMEQHTAGGTAGGQQVQSDNPERDDADILQQPGNNEDSATQLQESGSSDDDNGIGEVAEV